MPITPAEIQTRLNGLCKPPGSLGELEQVAARLCEIQQTLRPATKPRHASIFAGDHGVASEGVTAWPSEVTGAVVQVMRTGKSASGVFAKTLDCSYEVVDVGLLHANAAPKNESPNIFISAAVRRGAGNILHGPAMTESEFESAWKVGADRCEAACQRGAQIIIGGEMGIGNTTPASCLIGLFCNVDAADAVGRGAGINDDQLRRKTQVVDAAMQRVRAIGDISPAAVAAQIGGLEIVALAGYYAKAAELGRVILIDGVIATSAALLADKLSPGARNNMVAGHRSTEPGHVAALTQLGLSPILDFQMRLGEGAGALAALPMLDLAAAMMSEMASLSDLNVAETE